MITGANSGIGKVMALELAKMGANVVMACRSRERGEQARSEIIKATGSENVKLMMVDLKSMETVRGLVSIFKKRHNELHVLINNAAIVPHGRHITADGLEEQFVVNHLSHFLLTHLLLDVIKASAPSRIINVSSGIHKMAKMDFENLQGEKKYKAFRIYGVTKLMNIYFTNELARRLKGTGVTVTSFSPGFCSTQLGRESSSFSQWFVRHIAKSAEKGAQTGVHLAASPELEKVTGKYFVNMKEVKSSSRSYDLEAQKRIWKISEKMTHLTDFWK